jgi:hypothetical protein
MKVVEEHAAYMHYPKAYPAVPISADHINMIKYKGSEDGAYGSVQKQLARLESKLTASSQGS